MGKIICATRGGEASRKTEDRAIELAKERGDELVFLYVVDISFLETTAQAIVVDIEGGMEKMGGFILAVVQERAEAQGVTARAIHRRGRVREEIPAAILEEEADTLVMGRPAEGEGVFAQRGVSPFVQMLEAETGVEVVLA